MRAVTAALFVPLLFSSAAWERIPPAGDQCSHLPPAPGPRAAANDNRTPAGVRRGDTLVLSLVAAPSAWYPEAETGCALPVLAFAEAGKQPSVPGPLVRVRAGTVVRVVLRNAAGRTLWVRGLHDRPSNVREGVEVQADSVREFRFTAGTPGTYAYQATLDPYPAGGLTVRPMRDDSQLAGAFVIDPSPSLRSGSGQARASAPARPRDRVLVITRWAVPRPVDTVPGSLHVVNAVNGKSWPHTEEFTFTAGDSVHWRVVNASALPHPMHLHGFYFRVDGKGTHTGDTALATPRAAVTEQLGIGQTMRMSWRAEREGNWLFHCHLVAHMNPAQKLDRITDTALAALADIGARPRGAARLASGGHEGHAMYASHTNHARDGMAGLVIGVRVRPAKGAAGARAAYASQATLATHVRGDAAPRRTLRLFANQQPPLPGTRAPRYGFVLQEGEREPARDSLRLPGSPIVLRRGEPVQITVFNRLTMPLSVHWHGLELDSYFDGVGDWSGSAQSVAPPIAPGDSFVVRLTPPRAGTFMYHVHGHTAEELAGGLYGPLIVTDDTRAAGAPALDTLAERIVLVSDSWPIVPRRIYVNGSTTPSLTLTAGQRHRLRLIGITANASYELLLLNGSDTLRWRPLALDGAELAGAPAPLAPARRVMGPGMIADYELTPAAPGTLTLRLRAGTILLAPGSPGYVVRTLDVPITVVPPTISLGRHQP